MEARSKDIAVVEAPYASGLYRQSLRLREAILRQPLGPALTHAELVDDARIVGSVFNA